ncbi:MAG: GntG family PLP-dependent aldolase [Phycisphaerales bacterium]
MAAPALVDLRSDTVTRPTHAMWEAMRAAELGDDVLGDEPTVALLEARIARELGKEAAVFVPSGTMANQLAIRAVCGAGDEIVAHADSHIIHYEVGAPAALAGAMVRTVGGEGGVFDEEALAAAVRPANIHHPVSRMVVVENTQNRGGGTVWPLEGFARVARRGRAAGLHVHVDGARLFNACVAAGYAARDFAAHADSVSVCFSKGLGCPVGSALVADAATIARARRFRKMFGGGMRQSGLLAAAALHALDHHVARLAQDHEHARRLARGIAAIPGLTLQFQAERTPTNMVFFFVDPSLGTGHELCAALERQGVRMIAMDPQRARAVTHLDVDAAGIDRALAALSEAVAARVRSCAKAPG